MDELSKWLEKHKILKLLEEGNHAEVDRLIAVQTHKVKEENAEVEKAKEEQQKNEKL